jgi:hypothetical protein
VTNGVILEVTRLMTVFIFAQIWSSQVCPSPTVGQSISHLSSHCAFERIMLGGDKKPPLFLIYSDRAFTPSVSFESVLRCLFLKFPESRRVIHLEYSIFDQANKMINRSQMLGNDLMTFLLTYWLDRE